MRQVAVAHELGERRDVPQFPSAGLRIGAEQGLSQDQTRLLASLIERKGIGRTDLELPFAAAFVGIALIEGHAPRAADLKHEAALIGIEIIDLGSSRIAGRMLDEGFGQGYFGHGTLKRNFNETNVTPDDIVSSSHWKTKDILKDTDVVCDELRIANRDFYVVRSDKRGGSQ